MIRSQAAKKKETGDVAPTGTGPSIPSIKRKLLPKGDRPAKKVKVSLEPVVGLMAEATKTATPMKHRVGKSLMKGPLTNQEKPPILLREDSKHALEQISSIISSEDYEDLGNHSTEAMGETGLFAIAQVTQFVTFMFILSFCFLSNSFFSFQAMVMMKGLMGQCLSHETTLEHVRAKAKQTEDELNQLRSWKPKMEKKLELSEKPRKNLEQSTKEAKKALEGKDKEIQDLKDKLRQA